MLGESGRHDWVWALPILEEHGESGICVCVLVAVVCVAFVSSHSLRATNNSQT